MRGRVFEEIAAYYDALVSRFGHSPRASDYGRPESQQTKFRVLSEVLSPEAGRSVLDVGCGSADFAGFLERAWGSVRYLGIDLSASQVASARSEHPNVQVRQSNLLDLSNQESFDVVFANGIFYLLQGQAWELTNVLVTRMFALARVAVAFNSLSTWAPDHEEDEFHADPAALLELARSLTPWVVLRHDYHPRDVTLYLYREKQP